MTTVNQNRPRFPILPADPARVEGPLAGAGSLAASAGSPAASCRGRFAPGAVRGVLAAVGLCVAVIVCLMPVSAWARPEDGHPERFERERFRDEVRRQAREERMRRHDATNPQGSPHERRGDGMAGYPPRPYPGQAYPAQPYPARPHPAQPHPAQPYPAQPYQDGADPDPARQGRRQRLSPEEREVLREQLRERRRLYHEGSGR